tara:strand:+ start:249 stop:704 length:456 start_codon:yes stop_codon:yes gene_type:complete
MLISRAFAGLGSLFLLGCTPWPQSGYDRLEQRLERGPNRLKCFSSAWAREQAFDQPSPSILDGADIRFDPRSAVWKQSDDAVMAIIRTNYAGYVWEFAITEFGPSHYYSSDRYHCSKSASPIDETVPPLGRMTDEGTAMDGAFHVIDNPSR